SWPRDWSSDVCSSDLVDLYSWQAPLPTRLEFFGDQIESLREFDIDSQTSVRDLRFADILLGAADDQGATVRDYIARDHLKIAIEIGRASCRERVYNTV